MRAAMTTLVQDIMIVELEDGSGAHLQAIKDAARFKKQSSKKPGEIGRYVPSE